MPGMSEQLSQSPARATSSRAGDRRRRAAGTTGAAILRVVGLVKPEPDGIAELDAQRARLNARLLTATAQVDEARERRRDLYLADPIDDAALDEAERMLSVAVSRLAGVQEAVAALVEKIEATRRKVDAEADAAERDRVAAEYERRAGLVEKVAVALDKVAMDFDDRRRDLIEVVGREMIRPADPTGLSLYSRPELAMVAGASKLAGLTKDGPESAGGVAYGHAQAMRKMAAEIRAGTLAPELPGPLYSDAALAAVVAVKPIAMTRTVLSRPITFAIVGGGGGSAFSPAGNVELPVVVAEEAERRGIAHDPESADGKAIMVSLRRFGDHMKVLKRNADGVWVTDAGASAKDGGKLVAPPAFIDLGPLTP